jgi:hypothetical protein
VTDANQARLSYSLIYSVMSSYSFRS